MNRQGKYRFLFVGEMTLGNATFFQNLRQSVERFSDIESVWIPIEFDPPELLVSVPPFSRNWTLRAGAVARRRVLRAEKELGGFSSSFFHTQIPAVFLRDFRRRVPTIISLDATPLQLDEFGESYAHRVRHAGSVVEKMKHALTRSVYQDVATVMPWSKWTRDTLVDRYGVSANNISVLTPGVDLEIYHEDGRERNGKVNILFVGADFARKGGDLLLKVACRDDFRECEFHVVSKGLKRSIPSNVIIYPDLTPDCGTLRKLYRTSDIFVLPTLGDITPVSIIEAMASGLPVISTDIASIPELVVEGKTGYLIKPNDENELACKLHDMVSNRAHRIQMGHRARAFAEENLDLSKNARAIIDLMIELSERSQVDVL